MADTKESPKGVDVGQVASIAAIISALALFSGAVYTWAFTHGLLGIMGFPSQVVSLKTAVDAFPAVTVDVVGGLFGGLFLGFGLGAVIARSKPREEVPNWRAKLGLSRKEGRILICSVALVVTFPAMMFSLAANRQSLFLSGLLNVLFMASLVFIGISYQLLSGFSRSFFVSLFTVVSLGLGTQYMFQHGRDLGAEMAQSADLHFIPFGGTGFSSIGPADFPIVIISSKERLPLQLEMTTDGKEFTYQLQGANNFIRLILQDESNYYVVECFNGIETPFAIRKELVNGLTFVKAR